MRVVKASGRIEFIPRWITNLGDVIVKPAHERKAAIQNATLPIVNETMKIVVMFTRRYMSIKDYEAGTLSPNVPLDLWLKKYDMKNVLYRSRPSVKKSGEDEWLEIVMTVSQPEARKLMKVSGRDGVFVKPFRSKETPDDGLFRIVWLGPDVALSDALTKIQPIESRVLGLEVGRKGLGVRVLTACFSEVLPHILPKTEAENELRRRDQKIYEITEVPPWVAFENLKESMGGLWKWDIELVRVINRFRTKTFLVRASTAPPREAAIVDKQWMPIRLAPERPKPEVRRMVFTKTLGQSGNVSRETSSRRTESKQETGQPTTFSAQSSFEGTIQKFMRDFLSSMHKLEARMDKLEEKGDEPMAVPIDTDEESEFETAGEADKKRKLKKKKKASALGDL